MYEGAENALSKVPEVTLGFWIIKILATMYAASGYELLKSLKASGGGEDWGALAVAFLVSTITAFVAVKWLLGYIQTHRFTGFAIYRIILGILLLATVPWRP
jgi:undecaprenyl-diphosphatase